MQDQLTDSQTWVGPGSCAVLAVAAVDNGEDLQHRGTEAVLLLLVTMTTTGVCQSVLWQTCENMLNYQNNITITYVTLKITLTTNNQK